MRNSRFFPEPENLKPLHRKQARSSFVQPFEWQANLGLPFIWGFRAFLGFRRARSNILKILQDYSFVVGFTRLKKLGGFLCTMDTKWIVPLSTPIFIRRASGSKGCYGCYGTKLRVGFRTLSKP